MRLYLARHGDALPASADDARPLSEVGRAEVGRMATFLADAGVHVRRFVHSCKLRAEQTAEIYAAKLGPNAPIDQVSGLRPNDPPMGILALIASFDGDTLIAGHNPYLSSVVGLLVTGALGMPVCDLATGAVVCLELQPRYGWQLVFIVEPSLLT